MSDPTTFLLGGTRLVHRLGFGAMRLAANGFTGPPRDPENSREVLRRAVELGVDHIDTAAFYVSDDGSVSANTLIRQALHPYPERLVLATKVGPERIPGGGVRMATDPGNLRRMVEANLEELQLDHLDLVYLRAGGPMGSDAAESVSARVEALAAMRDEGLITHLGLSNVTAAQLSEAREISPIAAVQNNHAEGAAEILQLCETHDIAFVPFFPLGGGSSSALGEHIAEVARRHGATAAQVSLAALLASSPVTLAIPGTGSLDHLAENMAASSIELTDREVAELR